jgi:hypothetical protein
MTNHDHTQIDAWFAGRLPAEWTAAGPADITVDRDEITIVITVATPELGGDAAGRDEADVAEATAGRVAGFREDTRERRMKIAREAEHRFERKVAWGVRIGEETTVFTHLAAPVMTRLRQSERQVLDTLIAANVARSRADALAWCVRLVGKNTETWLSDLREALSTVDQLRADGPDKD